MLATDTRRSAATQRLTVACLTIHLGAIAPSNGTLASTPDIFILLSYNVVFVVVLDITFLSDTDGLLRSLLLDFQPCDTIRSIYVFQYTYVYYTIQHNAVKTRELSTL